MNTKKKETKKQKQEEKAENKLKAILCIYIVNFLIERSILKFSRYIFSILS